MTNSDEKTYALFAAPTNRKIVAELERRGAKVFPFSPPATEKAILDEKAESVIKNLDRFDWIIFPDVLTVDYFLEILPEYEIDLFAMDSVGACAFGESVADRLRFMQLHADVIPTSIDATNTFRALSDYIGTDQLSSLEFLLPKEISSVYEIKRRLIETGAGVVELPVYQAKISAANDVAKLKALFRGGAIDEFIFSSPSDLIALKRYFDDDSLAAIMREIKISAIDKAMIQTLQEHHLKADYFRLK